MARVRFEGTLGDEQLLLDDASGLPLGQKRQHLLFAGAQPVGGGQLLHAFAYPLLLGRTLDKTALFQDGDTPLARQLLLGEQQHRGRQNEHRHDNRHHKVLSGRRQPRLRKQPRNLAADHLKKLFGVLDRHEDHDGNAKPSGNIVEQQHHEERHERVADGDEIA